MFYNLRRAGRALRKMGAIDFATAIAPGLRDVLITGKIKEAVTRRHDGRPVYDAVVVDAPPTGRITRFLGVTAEMAQLARSGPIKTQSDGVMAVLRSPQTAVHLVTLLEDMPVQETADAIAELTKAELPVGSVIVNMATEPVLPDRRPDPRRRGPADRRRARARAGRRPPARRRRRSPTRWPPRSTEHARRWAGPGRAARRRRGAGPADGRAAAAHRPDGRRLACSSWPAGSRTTCAARWPRERRAPDGPHARARPAARPAGAADGPAALIADRETRIIVCCGAGGVGKTTTSAALGAGRGRGRPDGRRPDHRPGPAAGAVPRPGGAGQRAAAGRGRRGRRRTARDDAGHEAHVRRRRRRALDARAGRADPGQPLLPVAVVVLRRDAGVHGDGEAGPAAGQRPVGPDHRRHPAVPVGAGLPGRPEPDEPLPRRHDDPAAHRRRGRGAG